MAFDPGLAHRIRELLGDSTGISERKMFGGLAFMQHGNMFVGVLGSTLMARVGPDEYQSALQRPHVREMDFTGRPMRGYVYVDHGGIDDDGELRAWIDRCLRFVGTLPRKPGAGG